MSYWIDDLKRKEEQENQEQRRREEWRLRCDRLIEAKAPLLWQDLRDRVRSDFVKVAEMFPDKHLSFDDHGSREHFTAINPSKRWNFEARWMPQARIVLLEFRRAPDMLSPVQATREEIRFSVTGEDDVLMKFEGLTQVEAISERLIKSLL